MGIPNPKSLNKKHLTEVEEKKLDILREEYPSANNDTEQIAILVI